MTDVALPHTIGHIKCPACEATRVEMLRATHFPELKFRHAAQVWLHDTQDDIAVRTAQDHQDFVRALDRCFGDLLVKEIHIGHIRHYQTARQGLCKDPADNLGQAGPDKINHELSVLAKILDAAGLWKPLKPYYKCLRVPRSQRGRALTTEEEERLKMCAASNPRWLAVYLEMLITLNTTAAGAEVHHIRVKWMNMRDRLLSIQEGVKNDHRLRHFPMTDTIHWACTQVLKRYYRLCHRYAIVPNEEHYVFMKRVRDGRQVYDPWQPMGRSKSAWKSLTEKADLPGLRLYDLRHHPQTKLMEQPDISDHTIEEIAGHVTKDMKKQYRHIRDKKKLEALERIESKPAPRIVETVDGIVQIPVLTAKAGGK